MKDPLLGCYTVEKAVPPAVLFFDDLPQIYKDNYGKEQPIAPLSQDATKINEIVQNFTPSKKGKNYSALFDLKMHDLHIQHAPRDPHPIHDSEKTGGNFSISNDGSVANCWRCNVSLNAIQFLAAKSGEFGKSCIEVGTKHSIPNRDGTRKRFHKTLTPKMIFYAWRQAKIDGHISQDDPIPTKALNYIAVEHKLINKVDGRLPKPIYFRALKIVEDDY